MNADSFSFRCVVELVGPMPMEDYKAGLWESQWEQFSARIKIRPATVTVTFDIYADTPEDALALARRAIDEDGRVVSDETFPKDLQIESIKVTEKVRH